MKQFNLNPFLFLSLLFIYSGSLLAQSPNILLVIADDVGIDPVPGYFPGPVKANMPHLGELMDSGITFDNAWANPVCSPTRASMLTGKYGFRTNVLNPVDLSRLEADEVILHEYVDQSSNGSYASSLIGKWHLNGPMNNAPQYPNTCGVPFFSGLIGGGVTDYNNWRLIEGGSGTQTTEYVTSKFTDLAIDWINDQNQPWFCWLAYTAPHTPLHLPPDHMHSQGMLPDDSTSIADNPLPYYLAMLESVDFEIGRLMDNIPADELDNTIIIFIGDNGTPRNVVQQPYNRPQSKGSLFLGGVQVPLVISGAGVTRNMAREDALINATDLYATIGALTGSSTNDIHDSFSFKDLLTTDGADRRNCIYAEVKNEGDADLSWTAREETFKLIKWVDGTEAFYNLMDDPYEDNDLLPNGLNATEQNAYDKLEDYFNSSCAVPLTTSVSNLNSKKNRISLFPNPASNQITVRCEESSAEEFFIYDLLGSVVEFGSLDDGEQIIAIEHLSRGVYVFKWKEQAIRFVKQN